jgi:Spy/CpxP family protein refolding chaperone
MNKPLQAVVAILVVSMSALAWAAAQQTVAKPASQALPSQASIDEVLKAMRADMQTSRADLMAKNLTLTTAQAARFWPMFETYQKEQNVIMDDQFKGIQKFVETYNTLDDAGAMSLLNAHFDQDTRMIALRQRYLNEFQTVLPARLALRVMQIDYRLSLVTQLEVASRIPLVL